MIKHCQKFHFRIFRHGFLIPKHVRAGRHGILAPALKAETSIYQFLLFDLSASWFVGELSSYYPRPHHRWQSPNAPQFLEVFFSLWLHSLKKNDHIGRGNTYVEGVFMGGHHAIAFAQMHHAICQRRLSFLNVGVTLPFTGLVSK